MNERTDVAARLSTFDTYQRRARGCGLTVSNHLDIESRERSIICMKCHALRQGHGLSHGRFLEVYITNIVV